MCTIMPPLMVTRLGRAIKCDNLIQVEYSLGMAQLKQPSDKKVNPKQTISHIGRK